MQKYLIKKDPIFDILCNINVIFAKGHEMMSDRYESTALSQQFLKLNLCVSKNMTEKERLCNTECVFCDTTR